MKILIVEDYESEAFLIETLFRSNDDFAGELLHVADVMTRGATTKIAGSTSLSSIIFSAPKQTCL